MVVFGVLSQIWLKPSSNLWKPDGMSQEEQEKESEENRQWQCEEKIDCFGTDKSVPFYTLDAHPL